MFPFFISVFISTSISTSPHSLAHWHVKMFLMHLACLITKSRDLFLAPVFFFFFFFFSTSAASDAIADACLREMLCYQGPEATQLVYLLFSFSNRPLFYLSPPSASNLSYETQELRTASFISMVLRLSFPVSLLFQTHFQLFESIYLSVIDLYVDVL